MPNTSMGADAVCPFYIGDTATCIRCQSVCLSGESVQKFQSREEKETWQRDVCSNLHRYRLCPIAHLQYLLNEEE